MKKTLVTQEMAPIIINTSCCALCGVKKVLNPRKNYKSIPNSLVHEHTATKGCTPYEIANTILLIILQLQMVVK